ncbi:SNF2-related protein [Geodermatophilus sp. SYSU D00779]
MATGEALSVAPGSLVVVRDEEWLVTAAENTAGVWRLEVRGLTELVRGQSAVFFSDLDCIEELDPRNAKLVADISPRYRRARLWLEATLRKTPVPHGDPRLAVSHRMLSDPLIYQRQAVAHALAETNLRPRLLIADAVGLGKTLEIGMILSELARRGRAERILVVTPRHVLDQMQHELWTRFALPLVRLDSEGIQRIRQTLPASRNPFTYFNRVIVSIDTLKGAQYRAYLEKQRWDAVVIDESHNITNTATLNNELASVLAPNTEALILASATPHNGKKESFAELLRLLDPTAVTPEGEFSDEDVHRLLLRRHRHSPAVAAQVGADWAERLQPEVIAVEASPEEDALAAEIADTWLYPENGRSPYSGERSALFPWTLAKASLSSPAALQESVRNRRKRLDIDTDAGAREAEALDRLDALADKVYGNSAKLTKLVEHLMSIGIGRASATRVVLFAERVATLEWLNDTLPVALGMKSEQFAVLHGGLPDVVQQRIVEDFKLAHSSVRVLITGDVASEGVNLHAQCHDLVHVDLPWSLIRIEQRNGRIDRYGQQHPPRIAALALMPSHDRFSGDVRVLHRLLAKEHEAHTTLGDAGALMSKHSAKLEEDEIRDMLAKGTADLDDVVPSPQQVLESDDPLAALDQLFGTADQYVLDSPPVDDGHALFPTDLDFLSTALAEIYDDPAHDPDARFQPGVGWRTYPQQGLVELAPPADLRARLDALPQGYLRDHKVKQRLILATTPEVGTAHLRAARDKGSTTIWPAAHYLSPLHPVLDWVADKVLSDLGRNEVFAAYGDVDAPTVVLLATLMNRRGQVVSRQFVTVAFPTGDPTMGLAEVQPDLEFLDATGLRAGGANPGGVPITAELQALIAPAVDRATATLSLTEQQQRAELEQRLAAFRDRSHGWQQLAIDLGLSGAARNKLTQHEKRIVAEREIAESLAASQQLVRPLLLVVPATAPVEVA